MIWVAALALAVLLIAPLAEWRRRAVTPTERAAATGNQVVLSKGVTHYRWFGPPQGPVAVCIHGLTTPSFVWIPIAEGLALRGYRVLSYDLYGRGLSDRPAGAQDAAFFVGQLEELLKAVDVTEPAVVLGYSMGGVIAVAYADARPERVKRLILIAPAGLGLVLGRLARLVQNVPVLGDWLMLVLGTRMLRGGIDRSLPVSGQVRDIADWQAAEYDRRGTLPAVLSSQRNILAQDQAELHRRIGQSGLPVLAIWGEEDRVIPLTALGRLAEANHGARQVALPGAGHALPYTHPREILETIMEFLESH